MFADYHKKEEQVKAERESKNTIFADWPRVKWNRSEQFK